MQNKTVVEKVKAKIHITEMTIEAMINIRNPLSWNPSEEFEHIKGR